MGSENDQQLLALVRQGDQGAFEQLFRAYYTQLCRYALKFVRQPEICEELVHDTFMYLWERRETLEVTVSFEALLFTSVKNRCINFLKSKYHREQQATSAIDQPWMHPSRKATEEEIEASELELLVQKGVATLPEKCRIIFNLRNQTGMTYEEIGQELGISKKTVAAQMRIALQKLEAFLGEHWEGFICFFGWYLHNLP